VASKAETVPGTVVTLANADNNVRMWDLAIGSLDVAMDASPSHYATGDTFNGESIAGNQSGKITFNSKFHNTGDGTSAVAGTEPAWTKFVKACGCATSAVVATNYSGYDIYPALTQLEQTLTIAIYDKSRGLVPTGLKYEFAGAIGNCVVGAEGTGKPFNMQYDFTAGLNDITDVAVSAIPVLTSASTVIPDRMINGVATIGSFSACISNMSFDFGNQISPVECIGTRSGYQNFGIVATNPVLTFNPKLTNETSYDWWSKFTTGTIEAVLIETAHFRLSIPRGQITAASVADADGILRTELTISPLRNTSAAYNYAPWTITVKNFNKAGLFV
jgi:hypothetical protein